MESRAYRWWGKRGDIGHQRISKSRCGCNFLLVKLAEFSTTAVDIVKHEVRSRVAGSGAAGRGTGACAAMPTRTTRTRWSERHAIGGDTSTGGSPAH